MIANAESVTNIFGYWPEFADGIIKRFSYDRSGVLSMEINYIDSDQKKQALVGLRFLGITNLNLSDLLVENVIDKISIDENSQINVDIEACCGLGGSFHCSSVEVEYVNA